MTWQTVQQVLRILLYTLGSFLFGESIADGELFQGLIGGVMSVGSFLWWILWERNRPAIEVVRKVEIVEVK